MINQKYHFDITPHIVKQLGEQLVSDEITALLELLTVFTTDYYSIFYR